jgi:16S rRNA processing protein RimM
VGKDAKALIRVGRFGAPHGVRGEIRLQSFTEDPKAIASYGPLSTRDGRSFRLSALRPLKETMFVARVEGIADRARAETLTHTELFVARETLPPPQDDEFYVADLLGLKAVTAAGESLGEIIAVPNFGAGDLLEIRPETGGESWYVPFTKEVVPRIDFAQGLVIIEPPVEVE